MEIYGWGRIYIQWTTVDVQSSLSVSLTIFCHGFLIQSLVPVVGSIDLAHGIGDEDDALRRNAAWVFGGMNELAEGTLRLSDGHSDRDSDVDVRLVTSRTFHVKHFSLPKLDFIGRENLLSKKLLGRIIKHSVQQQGILYRRLHLLRVVDVHGGLEGKGIRVDGLLGTMVVEEVEVVRRAERQLLLECGNLLVELLEGLARLHLLLLLDDGEGKVILVLILRSIHSLSRLLQHQVLLGGEVTNLPYEGAEPRLLGKLGVVIEETSGNLTHVRITVRVHGDETTAHLLAFIK